MRTKIQFACAMVTAGWWQIAFAASLSCASIEYVQLKDSTKLELTKMYCRAAAISTFNYGMYLLAQERLDVDRSFGADTKEARTNVDEVHNAMIGCVQQQEAVSAMLLKRFKASSTPVCE